MRRKWCVQFSFLDAIITTVKVHFSAVLPKCVAHRKEFFCPLITFILIEKISEAAIIIGFLVCDQEYFEAAPNQRRQSVNLVDETCRLHQPRSMCDDEPQALG